MTTQIDLECALRSIEAGQICVANILTFRIGRLVLSEISMGKNEKIEVNPPRAKLPIFHKSSNGQALGQSDLFLAPLHWVFKCLSMDVLNLERMPYKYAK